MDEQDQRYQEYLATLPPPPATPRRSPRWLWAGLGIGAILCVLGGIWLLSRSDDLIDRGYSEEEGWAWTGLPDADGFEAIELRDYSSNCGIDCSVHLVLEGSPDDLDRMLDAASFDAEFSDPAMPGAVDQEDGVSDAMGGWPPGEVHIEPLVDPLVADDQIVTDGQTIYRRFLRSTLPNGHEQLVIIAFDT